MLSPSFSRAGIESHAEALTVQKSDGRKRDWLEDARFLEGVLPVAEWSTDWLAYTRADCVTLTEEEWEGMPQGVRDAMLKYLQAGGRLILAGGEKPDADFPVGFGAVSVLSSAAVKAWTSNDFRIFLSAAKDSSQQWKHILGNNCPYPTEASFAKPPVVFVYAVLLVIMIFLGPVLLVVLARRNMRLRIYWLVPSIAGGVWALILAFAFLREGVSVKSHAQSLLYLNEATGTQVQLTTLSMMTPVGLYSPLHFADTVEVTPAPSSQRHSSGEKKVSNGAELVLSSTWVSPRIPATFLLRDARALEVPLLRFEAGGGGVAVTNPLTAPIRSLLYCDAGGRYFALDAPLAPGASAVMGCIDGLLPSGEAHDRWLDATATLQCNMSSDYLKGGFFGAAALEAPSAADCLLTPKTYICELDGSPFFEHPLRRGKTRHAGKTLLMGEMQ